MVESYDSVGSNPTSPTKKETLSDLRGAKQPTRDKQGGVGQLGRVTGLKIQTVWVRIPPPLPI